jgi:hypothetical protein
MSKKASKPETNKMIKDAEANPLFRAIYAASQSCKTEDELGRMVSEATVLCIATLRGLYDDEFVKDFLTAARNEKRPVRITAHRVN